MDHRTSARFTVLLSGGVGTLMLAVIAGQPRLAALGAVPALLAVLATMLHRRPSLKLSIHHPPRTVEGDRFDLVVTIDSTEHVPWLEVNIELPPDLAPVNEIRHSVVSVSAGGRTSVSFPVRATRWGVATPGRVEAVARDRFGLFAATTIMRPQSAIRIHPADGNRRSTVAPKRLRVRVGAHQSRRRGEGSDFAEVRPFRTGDSLRSLNWRVTARRGERWITDRHPDQSGDLVFLLDNFRDIGPDGNQLVQRVVRAGMSLVESNLDLHDRVGLLDIGLRIRWFRPNQGRLHKARLLDALLESQTEPGLTSPQMNDLPLHELKAGSMVVVLTGLTDPQVSVLPIELKLRGLEVAVLECSADDHVTEPTDGAEELAIRLWRMLRAQRRKQLIDHGVPIMTWSAGQPLEVPVAALARPNPTSVLR